MIVLITVSMPVNYMNSNRTFCTLFIIDNILHGQIYQIVLLYILNHLVKSSESASCGSDSYFDLTDKFCSSDKDDR